LATKNPSAENERIGRIWDRVAPKYDRRIEFWERRLFEDGRDWVCSKAKGDVLEIAVGSGRNLPHYPDDVRVVGIEFSAAMLELAKERAASIRQDVDLRLGDAQALEFDDESFDTVTCTISLCSIPDDAAAIAEVKRVLRPGGRFIFMEHVRSPLWGVRALQTLVNPLTVWLEGDHFTREPLEHVRRAGFEIEHKQRLKLGIVERVVARKSA
jgi:ubiquinone/menaquinone biosynthesis C-methylase UbiE